MGDLQKNIIFIVIIVAIVAAAGAWYFYFAPPSTDEGEIVGGAPSPENEFARVRDQILANIAILEAIRLDTTILQDPAFLRLKKLERVEVPVEAGRPNPFLPYTRSAPASPLPPPLP